MGKIYYLMGKSASGKNALYEELMKRTELSLRPLVIYTTRPIRERETDGVDYHFTDIPGFQALESAGRVIEYRVYHTVLGDWYYFTTDVHIDLSENNYLGIGTLESYAKIRKYYGPDRVIPLYIELDDGERLSRALSRERKQARPQYEELCRRFLADQKDFSEENLSAAGITRRFSNDGELATCVSALVQEIKRNC